MEPLCAQKCLNLDSHRLLAQLTFTESLRGVHVAHNRSRDERQMEKMRELPNVCIKYHSIGNKQEYLDLITSLRG